jgi:hypothetical protein
MLSELYELNQYYDKNSNLDVTGGLQIAQQIGKFEKTPNIGCVNIARDKQNMLTR